MNTRPGPCRECRDGKHTNCDGRTWDYIQDTYAPCPCAGRDHGRSIR